MVSERFRRFLLTSPIKISGMWSRNDPSTILTAQKQLLARVRIKLWEQGVQTKGVIMDPSSGLIYPDSGVKILPDLRLSASADSDSGQPQYNMYFDDELSQQGRISVEFLEGGMILTSF